MKTKSDCVSMLAIPRTKLYIISTDIHTIQVLVIEWYNWATAKISHH